MKNLYQLSQREFPYFLEKNILSAFAWLEKNTDHNAVVLSSYQIGNLIPRFTGHRVFLGHGAQTIDNFKKYKETNRFFSNFYKEENKLSQFLKDNRISYIFKSKYEDPSEFSVWENELLRTGRIKEVYNKEEVKIYKVNF